jgi:hypothetical protein
VNQRELKKLAYKISFSEGDAISGERVIAQARSISNPTIVSGTSGHRIKQIILRTNVFCLIDKAFRIRGGKIHLK